MLSVERHVLRNFVFLYAIEHNLPLPIGTSDAGILDTQSFDKDADSATGNIFEMDEEDENIDQSNETDPKDEYDFRAKAAEIYQLYSGRFKNRFRWLPSRLFVTELNKVLTSDTKTLTSLIERSGPWQPTQDAKLDSLEEVLKEKHPNQKVLVFSQFADTVQYLDNQLKSRSVSESETRNRRLNRSDRAGVAIQPRLQRETTVCDRPR